MPPTQNPKMGDYPNIERRLRIRAAKKIVYFKYPLEMDLEGLHIQDVVMHQPQSLFLQLTLNKLSFFTSSFALLCISQ